MRAIIYFLDLHSTSQPSSSQSSLQQFLNTSPTQFPITCPHCGLFGSSVAQLSLLTIQIKPTSCSSPFKNAIPNQAACPPTQVPLTPKTNGGHKEQATQGVPGQGEIQTGLCGSIHILVPPRPCKKATGNCQLDLYTTLPLPLPGMVAIDTTSYAKKCY